MYFFRHEALEEEEECLFSKLTALVCVNRFLLLIFLVLELAHGHEHALTLTAALHTPDTATTTVTVTMTGEKVHG